MEVNNQHTQLQETSAQAQVMLDERTELVTDLEGRLNEMDLFLQHRAEEYEHKCVELEQVQKEALSEREGSDKLVAELNEEVLGLRGDRENLETKLTRLSADHEGSVDGQELIEANKKVQQLKEEARVKIEKLRAQVDDMREKVMSKAQELSDEKLDHQADVKLLEGKLEEERLHMQTFKGS